MCVSRPMGRSSSHPPDTPGGSTQSLTATRLPAGTGRRLSGPGRRSIGDAGSPVSILVNRSSKPPPEVAFSPGACGGLFRSVQLEPGPHAPAGGTVRPVGVRELPDQVRCRSGEALSGETWPAGVLLTAVCGALLGQGQSSSEVGRASARPGLSLRPRGGPTAILAVPLCERARDVYCTPYHFPVPGLPAVDLRRPRGYVGGEANLDSGRRAGHRHDPVPRLSALLSPA
jgi:hypothetical protein